MKGEKGIPGVTVGEGLGEELTDESFCKYKCLHFAVNTYVLRLVFIPLKLKTLLPLALLNDTASFFCGVLRHWVSSKSIKLNHNF